VAYVEYLTGSAFVSCTWEQRTDTPHQQRVVPDACVDLIWTGERLTIAGPDTAARLVMLPAGVRMVGLRLRPGVAGAVLGLPACELRDEAPDAAEVLGPKRAESLLDHLAAGGDPHAMLLRAIELAAQSAPDPLVGAAVDALDNPRVRVATVAAELGLSARQLQRRVVDAVGYGPKMLARVLRFRRLQALSAPAIASADGSSTESGGGSRAPLVDLALDAGYADQAHMTAEVTRLAGLSPVRFLKDRTPTIA
jgi:AraC-like DNA-binding protein